MSSTDNDDDLSNAVAIIGMTGRFPEAADIEQFWQNLRSGFDSVMPIPDEALRAQGIDEATLADPAYIKKASTMADVDKFDAGFFGISPREAEIMDPQHRIFLECCWSALEHAGYSPRTYSGAIGLYAGAASSAYLFSNLMGNPRILDSVGPRQLMMVNEKDFLCGRAAYQLNLHGPAVLVQTACSTSLVAIHIACQSVLSGECDIALAGGVSIDSTTPTGFHYHEGGLASQDGHCHAFDHRASGIISGSGCALVVLKSYAAAVEDGDTIHAIIRGSAINNDGSDKISFTAPSVQGQAAAIVEAQAMAGVDADSITYVEAHGTGTMLGDPIEISALKQAFAQSTDKKQFCAIGSLKTNVGHMDVAAGVGGLIKAALALRHREIPPSLHFEKPNPHIDFDNSPFFVNTELRPWHSDGPRRAAVSSFGIGGTNAHVVLEEAPEVEDEPSDRAIDLLLLAARSEAALNTATSNLANFLQANPATNLADCAWTLLHGREAFRFRRAVAAQSVAQAVESLNLAANMGAALQAEENPPPVVFLCPGGGTQYPDMGLALYQTQAVYRATIDECAKLLQPILQLDIRSVLYPQIDGTPEQQETALQAAHERMDDVRLSLPALFSTEYAMAQQYLAWGIKPSALVGHSLGEYVCACLAGVFSLKDALTIVSARGRLIATLPSANMIAVLLPEAETNARLAAHQNEGLWLACVNAQQACTISGTPEATDKLAAELEADGVEFQFLRTWPASHSGLMEPILADFRAVFASLKLNPPKLPYLSNLVGDWIKPEQATSPDYWVAHLRQAVQFAGCVQKLLQDPSRVYVEIGPGHTLCNLLKRDVAPGQNVLTLTSMPRRDAFGKPVGSALVTASNTLGQLWAAGLTPDWEAWYGDEARRRIVLPTYPFERKRYWIDATGAPMHMSLAAGDTHVSTSNDSTGTAGDAAAAPADTGSAPKLAKYTRPALPTPYIAASNANERLMCSIWEATLGVAPIGVQDDFFMLGGNSLISIQLAAQIRARFRVELTLRALFKGGTIAAQIEEIELKLAETGMVSPAEELEAQAASGTASAGSNTADACTSSAGSVGSANAAGAASPAGQTMPEAGWQVAQTIFPRQGEAAVPLSFTQQRLWFIIELDPSASAAYHISKGITLHGRFDPDALQAALNHIVARHESLRTRFAQVGDQLLQVIDDAATPFALSRHDISDLSGAAQQHSLDALRIDEVAAPFDLRTGPLIRGRLIRLAAEQHVLFVTLHHIIADGWSMGTLIQEVSALYSTLAALPTRSSSDGAGMDPQWQALLPQILPALPLQYPDYALWQRQHLQGEALQQQLQFWKNCLGGAPALLELPLDHARPPVQSYAGAHSPFAMGSELTSSLRQLAQRHGATLFQVLLAGWAVLLSRLSGQDDVVIGTPVANRTKPELEGLIGFFANTLALRVKPLATLTVAQLLKQVKTGTLEAYDAQDLPFDYVVDAVQPERSMSYGPIFQVMINLHNTPQKVELKLGDLSFSGIDMEEDSVLCDMMLSLSDHGTDISGSINYSTALFAPATVARMGIQLRTVLAAMAADDASQVARLPLLSGSELQQILQDFNATALDYDASATMHGLFEAQAARTPDAIAIGWHEHSLSYAELNLRANRLAHKLIALGVKPDDRVAIYSERNLLLVVGMLAILKAGGSYVPLDPAYPPERRAYMLKDSAPQALLTLQSLLPTLPADCGVPLLVLDSDAMAADLATSSADNDRNPVAAGLTSANLAYLIYTSGSTGVPKGVLIEHRNAVNLLAWARASFSAEHLAVCMFSTSVNFDLHVYELWVPLSLGSRISLVRDGISAHEASDDITLINTVPSSIKALLDLQHVKPSVKLVNLAGEALGRTLVERLFAETPVEAVANLYGPSETTTYSTWIYMPRESGFDATIGHPVANTQVYIVDAYMQPVPIGVAGEIYIAGDGVARGYLNLPDLTEERFLPDPFSSKPGARMYKTGDLGRWLVDGRIEYLGRNDFQVKIRGFRIELGEVEARLLSCNGVREAVVMARDDAANGTQGDKRLVAYLVAQQGATLSAASLRQELAHKLASFMLPSSFITLPAFPLTPNGKLDRSALPAPDLEAVITREYAAPVSQMEQQLASLWQELLGVPRIGRDDHFFELGGHSLLAVQLAGRIRQQLDIEIRLRDLFDHPTLAAFASVTALSAGNSMGALELADRSVPLPLSFAQQRLWFLDQLNHEASRAYHMPAALRLSGQLDRTALLATLNRIVARHESLRTTFALHNEEPVQVIAPRGTGFALRELDLSSLAPGLQEQRVDEIASAEILQSFDLASGPLIRGQLLRLAPDQHVLLLTQHHIITDGWSLGVLVREVTQLYAALVQGQPDPLPPLARQYPDYAAWQRQWLQGEVLQTQIDFWKKQLSGAPSLLTLPTDRARPPIQDLSGATVALTLSLELTAGLRQLAQRHGATLFMTLLCGWSTLLARLAGQDDIVIGTPVANRRRSEIEGMIGLFVNTLALRVRFDGESSVAQLLEQVKSVTLGAYEHQDLPFEQVVEILQPSRNQSHSAVFQSMLNVANTPDGGSLQLPGLSISPIEKENTTSKFDLALLMTEVRGPHGPQLSGSISYATALFDAASVERIAGYFTTLLDAMVRDEQQLVSALPLQSAAQNHSLLAELNPLPVAYPQQELIHRLFEAQVSRSPDAPALAYEGQSLSYQELNRQANQLAHYLVSLGAKPDLRVAICVERGMNMLICLLAVLKSGAGYVPLDPAYPSERLAWMLQDSTPLAVITQQSLLPVLPPAAGAAGSAGSANSATSAGSGNAPLHVVLDGAHAAQIAAQNGDNLPVQAEHPQHAAHLAYIIYTSGSTGLPKGVMVEHRSVINLWQALSRTVFRANPAQARVGFNAPISFDSSVKNVVQWLNGCCLRVIPQEARQDGTVLLAWLKKHDVQVFDCTPAQLDMMCHSGLLQDASFDGKTMLVGGEAISAHRWQELQSARLNAWNVYGPTECTVDATVAEIRACGSVPTIGRPIQNTRIYLLDSHLQLVPRGVSGEIYIGGAGVARGYLNRAELTDERFLPDPFADAATLAPGQRPRMYKTGDLGRWLPDGSIEYHGRNDFQVKIRGFRIEPGEIEARLVACPGVDEAVVLARDDDGHGTQKRLVAYLIAHEGVELSIADIRAELASSLADYMVPAAFVVLPAFPLTPNGKLDRKALPAPSLAAVVTRSYEAPQGETEQALARIWQQLLHLPQVGRHDHFFELGGHSLLAVQLAGRIRQELGMSLLLRDLFNHPTLGALAQVLSGTAAGATAKGEPGERIMPVPRSGGLPLSFAQQRLWFLDQLDPIASRAYHMPAGLRLTGQLDENALAASLDMLVARHEGLRTRFVSEAGQPLQLFAPSDCGFALTRRDLSSLAAHEQDPLLASISRDEFAAPFDLAQGPLIRGQLLRLSESEHVLLLTQHHIVSDGWSTGILIREVCELYTALCQRAPGHAMPNRLPPLPLQYADYAAWQRNRLEGEVLQQQIDFWREHLQGAPALLELPLDQPRNARQGHAGATLPVLLPASLSNRLRQLSQSHGSTLFMTLLAAWASLLARLSGQPDVVIGTPVANRQRPELEGLIGFFVNTLALRVNLSDDPKVDALLSRVRDNTIAAFEHQDLPFEQVVEVVQPVRSMSYSPLFQNLFSLNNTPDSGATSLPGLSATALSMESSNVQFDLILSLAERESGGGGEIGGSLTYCTDLFEAGTAQRFIDCFGVLLEAMVADPQQPVSHLPLLDPGARQRVLQDFNQNSRNDPQGQLIQHLFEQQVAAQPNSIALVYGREQLSYQELNWRANRLARHLQTLGLNPDERIAICLERGIDMIVSILAVFKAGCAYVPLDPAYPAERLAYMLHDSSPVALLTHSALLPGLPALTTHVLALDQSATLWAQQGDDNLTLTDAHDGMLAYVIYTSGSTGMPKGVMNHHRGLCNLTRSLIEVYGVTPQSRVLQFVSVSFDVCISEITQALCSGATLVVAPAAELLPGQPLLDTLAQHAITHVSLPMAVLAALPQDASLATVKALIVGGEALPPPLAALWGARHRLFNSYGPTETTVCATVHEVPQAGASHGVTDGMDAPPPMNVPIGRPLANTRILILDARRQPVPVGVTGEIYIGGVQVARGYLNRPDLSAETFIADPFSSQPDARLYKTGDLGRWLANGEVEYRGRNDFQVKIRGFRIELGEIEARLCAIQHVREAAVLARDDGAGKRLVAYLIPEAGSSLSVTQLRAELATGLAEHMLPQAFVMMDSFPLTSNGKVDRNALPAPDEGALLKSAWEAPQGEVESAIAAIWEKLLKVERVGRNDQFFELGGHSLMAVKLMAQVEKQLGFSASLRELFANPVLKDFALAVSGESGKPRFLHLATIRAHGRQTPLFLVHPGEGEAGYARELAPWLDADMPIYSLSARGFLADEEPLMAVEEMATHYLREIRQVQPHGPYRVAGWSAGGSIAWEIARQMLGSDEQVQFVGLIDTPSNYNSRYRIAELSDNRTLNKTMHLLRRLPGLLKDKISGPAPVRIASDFNDWISSLIWVPDSASKAVREELKRRAAAHDIDGILTCSQAADIMPADIETALLKRHLKVRHAIVVATRNYVHEPLPVPVALFLVRDEARNDPDLGWKANPNLLITRIVGNHYSIMEEPLLVQTAAALNTAIATHPPLQALPHYEPKVPLQFGQLHNNRLPTPLFCVPGAGASVTSFTEVAHGMGEAMPVYGLQPRGLSGDGIVHSNVESAARFYIEAMRQVAPHGPYHLLGHSFGGWVVCEMARQLSQAGESIASLIVLDSEAPLAPGAYRPHVPRVQMLMQLVSLFEQRLNAPLGITLTQLQNLTPDAQLALLHERLIEQQLLPARTGVSTLAAIVRVFASNLNTDYNPAGIWAGDLHLVLAADEAHNLASAAGKQDIIAQWRQFAPRTRLWITPGNHTTLLSVPHIHALNKLLLNLMKEPQ